MQSLACTAASSLQALCAGNTMNTTQPSAPTYPRQVVGTSPVSAVYHHAIGQPELQEFGGLWVNTILLHSDCKHKCSKRVLDNLRIHLCTV